ncbi:Crp/Fnr family transcriptional regulator [Neolewinella lacunae]|uniref:Crp/Fnr family transcriptional regulator n=1 Tax=Neolewinella lacunae TaxID=1517758 RepID=A0A923PSB8_9BACT|nr:Crp/Fnr family transcriptional regulator [Neolewinella lacunae]MBC6995887.1 Crp/Fnr family transcriptional regulator [Neolewinella lacunae]MDN3636421.1 Crp/Fnr family transcriptional regulator [Neolewinella lacunae]
MAHLLQQLYDYLDGQQLWHSTLVLKRGDHLLRAGATDTNVYYLEEGTLHYYLLLEDEAQEVRFGYAGDFVVALDSFLVGRPSSLYAQALRKTTVRVLPQSVCFARIKEDPAFNQLWQQIMHWMVLGQLEREIDLLTNDTAERYRRVLERSPRLFQEIPAKYIANYLRMTPETLSRCKSAALAPGLRHKG